VYTHIIALEMPTDLQTSN